MALVFNATIFAVILFVFGQLYMTISMTYPPVWITNNYVRAGNSYVISTLTGNNQTPTYTFPFSSPFTTGIPNLGYGIKAYQGKFHLIQEMIILESNFLKSTGLH